MSITDFEILAKIGEGAFSSVHKVLRKSDQTFYALKKVDIRKMNKKSKQNALNEIRILASIDHPNIISYKQAFFDKNNETLCIVMEYADAGDLLSNITKHKQTKTLISEKDLWDLLIKLARALKVLHETNIMHRDLKSANIFLGKEGKVKLGDLNVSKVVKDSLVHTQTGTPYYASPEVWRDEPYDFKSDIWSLGCVIYEAAALRPPFRSSDMKGLYRKVIAGKFAPLHEFSEDFNEMVKLLLKLDPKERPSASEILNNELVRQRVKTQREVAIRPPKLLRTISIGEDFTDITTKLPKDKYPQSAREGKREGILPSIIKIKKSQTTKCMEDLLRNQEDSQYLGNCKNVSELERKSSVKNIVNEFHARRRIQKAKSPDIVSLREIIRMELLENYNENKPLRKFY
jgi:NIMA (never in mitosis gene a)-related kinase